MLIAIISAGWIISGTVGAILTWSAWFPMIKTPTPRSPSRRAMAGIAILGTVFGPFALMFGAVGWLLVLMFSLQDIFESHGTNSWWDGPTF